jgi:hypothetical protein
MEHFIDHCACCSGIGVAFLVQANPISISDGQHITYIVSLNTLLTGGLALAATPLCWLTPFTWVDRILSFSSLDSYCLYIPAIFLQDGDVRKHILLIALTHSYKGAVGTDGTRKKRRQRR